MTKQKSHWASTPYSPIMDGADMSADRDKAVKSAVNRAWVEAIKGAPKSSDVTRRIRVYVAQMTGSEPDEMLDWLLNGMASPLGEGLIEHLQELWVEAYEGDRPSPFDGMRDHSELEEVMREAFGSWFKRQVDYVPKLPLRIEEVTVELNCRYAAGKAYKLLGWREVMAEELPWRTAVSMALY